MTFAILSLLAVEMFFARPLARLLIGGQWVAPSPERSMARLRVRLRRMWNSVWSCDLGRASWVVETMVAGHRWINAHNVFVHRVPYGGIHLSGMGGGVLGPGTLFYYLRELSVVHPLSS